MSRLRALLAILLAVTWCSAAWHVDLEAVGLMLEHQHQGHSDADHADDGVHDTTASDHAPLLVSHVVKDGQIRVVAIGILCIALLGVFAASGLWLWQPFAEREPIPITRRFPPPLQRIWQFVQRCAPNSAAPPALA